MSGSAINSLLFNNGLQYQQEGKGFLQIISTAKGERCATDNVVLGTVSEVEVALSVNR